MKTCAICLVMVFSIFEQDCIGKLTVVPKNTAVHEGSEAVLQCRTNSTNATRLLWRTQFSENKTVATIYSGNRYFKDFNSTMYDVNNSAEGQFDLRIKAYSTTAGRYICDEPGAENSSAELVVLVYDPVCTHIDGIASSHKMECRIGYAGNWPPVMEWSQVTGGIDKEAKLMVEGVNSNASKFTVVSTLTFQRNETRTEYVCTTKFNADGRPRLTTATNIPEYSFNWTYADDAIHTSSITAESSSTQQFSTDKDITTAATSEVDPSEVDVLKTTLIFLITLCTLLIITACITYKKTDAGCKSKPRDTTANQDGAETITSFSSTVGLEERRIGPSPRVTDGGEDSPYDVVQDWRGTNYLHLCPGSVASLPLAKPEEGAEPPRSPRYFGDDGTEYMEMNGLRREPTTAPQTHPTTNNSVYARIDHTMSTPPPRW